MTDLEMTKLCAVEMGLRLLPAYPPFHVLANGRDWNGLMLSSDGKYLFIESGAYDPLTDDAQAMALVKKLGISVRKTDPDMWDAWIPLQPADGSNANLNRAIVECASSASTATRIK